MITTQSLRGRVALMVGHCAGMVDLVALPVWVGTLMLSPLDAYRVTLLFVLERAAFSGADLHPLTRWWLDNAVLWLTLCLAGWCAVIALAATAGASYRRTR